MEAQLIRRDHEGLIGADQQVDDITEHEQKKDLCTPEETIRRTAGSAAGLPPPESRGPTSAPRAIVLPKCRRFCICEVYVLPGLFTQEPRHEIHV
jgi:hypothetical protein